MANAIAGVGTTFERWSGSAWQFIAEINAIEGPTMDKENIEVTALDTDGGYDEFITGFMEGGTLTLNMNFSRSGYELMKQDFEIDVARDYRITLPDDEDTTLEFEGLVIEIPLTMEAEDKLTADVTIQVTGEVAIASAGAESSEEEVPSEDVSSGSYDADVEAYIAGLATGLSAGFLDKLNTFVAGLKSDMSLTNLSDAFDAMYVFANETEEAALRNLVQRDFDATNEQDSAAADCAFTALEGFTGGNDNYIDTNFVPATDASNYKASSADYDGAFGIYARTTPGAASSATLVGCFDSSNGSYITLQQRITISTEKLRFMVAVQWDYKQNYADSSGMLIGAFNDTNLYGYRNKTQLGTDSAGGDATLSSKSIWLLCARGGATGDTPQSFSDCPISFFFIGKYLTQTEVNYLTDRFEAFMDANGKGVI
jgi:predicted secreted protein